MTNCVAGGYGLLCCAHFVIKVIFTFYHWHPFSSSINFAKYLEKITKQSITLYNIFEFWNFPLILVLHYDVVDKIDFPQSSNAEIRKTNCHENLCGEDVLCVWRDLLVLLANGPRWWCMSDGLQYMRDLSLESNPCLTRTITFISWDFRVWYKLPVIAMEIRYPY